MLGLDAIFDPAFAHPDMLFGNAARGGPGCTHLDGAHPRRSKADLTRSALSHSALFSRFIQPPYSEVPATTDRASLISVTTEAIATLGTVP